MQSIRCERTVFRLAHVTLALFLASCASTSASYVIDHPGFSVMRGEIKSIGGLSTAHIERLADGVAYTVGVTGCQVDFLFADESSNQFALQKGNIIVLGAEDDYILQSKTSSKR